MKQVLHFITLGVKDLESVKKFYVEKFGWTPLKDGNGIVFFKLNGFILSLFPENELAEDAGVPSGRSGFKGFTLSVNFASEQEVDQAFAQLKNKGVSIIKKPQKVFWGGYSGYVEDIEHNLWELVFNPYLVLDKNGSVKTHK